MPSFHCSRFHPLVVDDDVDFALILPHKDVFVGLDDVDEVSLICFLFFNRDDWSRCVDEGEFVDCVHLV